MTDNPHRQPYSADQAEGVAEVAALCDEQGETDTTISLDCLWSLLLTIREAWSEIARLQTCPVCDDRDPDGLEACSKCYSAQIAETAKMRTGRDRWRDEVEQLRGENNHLADLIESVTSNVITGDSCPYCGDSIAIRTACNQAGLADGYWAAFDGDPADCVGCGRKGIVHCDAESEAWIDMEIEQREDMDS